MLLTLSPNPTPVKNSAVKISRTPRRRRFPSKMAAFKLVVVVFSVLLTVYVRSGEDSQDGVGFCDAGNDNDGILCQSPIDSTEHFNSAQPGNQSGGNFDGEHTLIVLTVATERTDGFIRFLRSAKFYGITPQVLGMDEEWKGGDISNGPGGGYKVHLLKAAASKYKDVRNAVLMFVDSYDVIFAGTPKEILNNFYKFKANVVFSAEGFCWPDENLASSYPKVARGKPYLNSGGFIGYASQLYDVVSSTEIDAADDDQLFYTQIYLSEELRKKWGIKLDHRAEIFQNLNGATGDVELRGLEGEPYVYNSAYGTTPLVIHGNGPSKIMLNSLGNYIAKSWNYKSGCLVCDDKFSLEKVPESNLPRVLLGIFVEHATPFLKEFLHKATALRYPKENMDLFVHNAVEFRKEEMDAFVNDNSVAYRSVKYFKYEDDKKEWHARNLALEHCVIHSCDYFFSLDSDAQIDNPDTLRLLIEKNRTIVAPLLTRQKSMWSNFWGALSADGFYARSHDYVEIVKGQRTGLWNVPFISTAYLINATLLKSKEKFPSYISGLLDPDMAFCKNLRSKGIFIHVSNTESYGHLVNADTFDISRKHPDFYEIYSNQRDWEDRYIHKDYFNVLRPTTKIDMPCPDVYWFPVGTEIFCEHLIGIMENFGQWSSGNNEDERLAGGYENVPTRDIHMNQVGLEQHWLYFLREYIRPVQEKIFIGYFHDPPKAIMNFVVRYHPNEQSFLRPHHDSSTYTINIALNRPGIDYEGGGCNFIRYNCSVVDLKRGWSLMHPGRLTHYHEGLVVTKGTRYIMVSFVDP
ncbi:procollagen-lysine,2-oxoglutarate 5-dioxygenase 1-like isoform X2 [Ornithodoros turicata]|uniref:procollagen-lysine,2-oxoglutarate 5-dioxygenase 1-like isoform X2 n=1 Tax=Ornithodoros turicata TaxID=34597 RepID=UPI0031398279